MICYSIIAKRGIVTSFSSMHSPVVVEVVEDAYPKPKLGIIASLEEDTFYVEVGDKKVPVSAALALSETTEKLNDGRQLRITRAAAAINAKGDMELVPDNGDDESVLLLIDVSAGRYGGVAFECSNGFSLIQRGFQNLRVLQGEEEVVLAALHRGDSVTARRSEKKYIWFGKASVHETMTFTLDPDLHCTLKTASEAAQRVF